MHGYHQDLEVFGALHNYGGKMLPLLANRIGYRNHDGGRIIDK